MLSDIGPHWFFSQRNILESPVQEVHPIPGQARISPCPAPIQLWGVGLILGGFPCPWPVVATNTSQPLLSKRKAVPKEAVSALCPAPGSSGALLSLLVHQHGLQWPPGHRGWFPDVQILKPCRGAGLKGSGGAGALVGTHVSVLPLCRVVALQLCAALQFAPAFCCHKCV